MQTILLIHQSADLYGSDKHILHLIDHLPKSQYACIVLLPERGPLQRELHQRGIETHIGPLLKISRATFSIKNLIRSTTMARQSVKTIEKVIGDRKVDLVHSNTLAVLTGALWARKHRVPHLWNVHEMIDHPWIAAWIFPILLSIFADKVVCNSKATLQLIVSKIQKLKKKSIFVWNGIERPSPPDMKAASALRASLHIKSDDIVVALVGRINRWKGQPLLIQAVNLLAKEGITNPHFLIVGSPPHDQSHFLIELLDKVDASIAKDRIHIIDFKKNIWPIWDSCDIAVVPSTEQEPFGFVAVEAMAAGKPVVAANHGGLTEIVSHHQTGLLFKPNSAPALARALKELIVNTDKRVAYGLASKARVKNHFSLRNYVAAYAFQYQLLIAQTSTIQTHPTES